MPFYPPKWVPPLPTIPDHISIDQFLLEEAYGRQPFSSSEPPFVCGLTGRTYDFQTIRRRVDYISRSLNHELGFDKLENDSEWNKVITIFSANAIDYIPVAWSVSRLGGIVSLANAAYTAAELEKQLKHSGSKAVFTNFDLLEQSEEACRRAGISRGRIFIIPVAGQTAPTPSGISAYKTIGDLVLQGSELPPLAPIKWKPGEGAKRIAVLAYSSGTSGLPKGVMLTHKALIANILQCSSFESVARQRLAKRSGLTTYTENCLGVVPFSHIYGFTMVCHVSAYRGDGVVVLPKYNLEAVMRAIQRHSIALLYLVPPIIIDIIHSRDVCKRYDLDSVRAILTVAAPLKEETAMQLKTIFPSWAVRQAYGCTETAGGVSNTSAEDIWFGSVGSLLAGNRVRLVTPQGEEITEYGRRGEICVHSPAMFTGYFQNDAADREAFVEFEDGRYMRSGDEGMVGKSDSGNEHLFITDRIKELIKVKGIQVAPAELEAHLLTPHPAVDDCAVIGVPSDREGEIPKAYIVRSTLFADEDAEKMKNEIAAYVREHKARHMALAGGIEFVDAIPKSPSGKILRRILRDGLRAEVGGVVARL